MSREDIERALFQLRDEDYRTLLTKLIPTVAPERMIGVRTPALRNYAKALVRQPETDDFLQALPHRYFDENQLHAFILSEIKDFDRCVREVDRFLPYVDNWATSDQLSPKAFKKYRRELLPYIRRWMASGKTYPVRFGVGMLMQHYLEEDFDPAYPRLVAGLRSEEYYVNMMRAWYFATALSKRYDDILPYLESDALDPWTHNKAIQKAVESYRITDEQKTYLRRLKVRSK
jgi:3-methyladenine DNA glycosylase AlkD